MGPIKLGICTSGMYETSPLSQIHLEFSAHLVLAYTLHFRLIDFHDTIINKSRKIIIINFKWRLKIICLTQNVTAMDE